MTAPSTGTTAAAVKNLGKGLVALAYKTNAHRIEFWWWETPQPPRSIPVWKLKALLIASDGFEAHSILVGSRLKDLLRDEESRHG